MDTGSKSESSETSKETPTCEQKQADGFLGQCRSRVLRIWLFQILEESKIRGWEFKSGQLQEGFTYNHMSTWQMLRVQKCTQPAPFLEELGFKQGKPTETKNEKWWVLSWKYEKKAIIHRTGFDPFQSYKVWVDIAERVTPQPLNWIPYSESQNADGGTKIIPKLLRGESGAKKTILLRQTPQVYLCCKPYPSQI